MSKQDQLETLDLASLSKVTGGTTTTDQDLMTALGSIVSSLQNLAPQQNSFNPQTMMMMMMMMEQRNQGAVAVAPAYPSYPSYPTGNGWYY